jgi:hypothetical protein
LNPFLCQEKKDLGFWGKAPTHKSFMYYAGYSKRFLKKSHQFGASSSLAALIIVKMSCIATTIQK